jgi:hypothetical protein
MKEMIISVDVEEDLDKTQHHFMIKALKKSTNIRDLPQYNKC